MQYKYLVVVEKGETNYGVYSPDVPGCGSIGGTPEEALKNFEEALQFHLEGILHDGDPAPEAAHSDARFMEVDVAVPVRPGRR
jgi:predicted RNase H-like HicB family nuclease